MSIDTKKKMLKRIDCAYVPVADPAVAAEWYERVLGLELRSPIKPGRGAIMIMGDGQWLFLLPSPNAIPLTFTTTGWAEDDTPVEMFAICFETEDIYSLNESLQAAGAWKEEDFVDESGCGLSVTFKDLDGNKFQAWQQPK
ncbi:VOC family protein [Paenibacillus eucommiae]|uniref:Catechol 2,3-dioxygenase-like lactoylglutathione lyase family enzyme n=1 Tax=Paenibacillus eucommiae TaxID=1355755 RepID=A0ABS4IP48_9BACL|nr:VOC family protein [Paenibacillus eucommiae]MBP1989327.1 catechol 2,3-dioxygenase-like lactoylglutathione lyase family enzyme [Paenibacillus eucommiae]